MGIYDTLHEVVEGVINEVKSASYILKVALIVAICVPLFFGAECAIALSSLKSVIHKMIN